MLKKGINPPFLNKKSGKSTVNLVKKIGAIFIKIAVFLTAYQRFRLTIIKTNNNHKQKN